MREFAAFFFGVGKRTNSVVLQVQGSERGQEI